MHQLSSVFDARLIDDDVFSSILKVRRKHQVEPMIHFLMWVQQATWGTELGANAIASREEKRRAEFVLPFKDRKVND